MTTRVYTDRSRIESFQRCPRLRFLEYHQDGTGITPARKSLPLAFGGAAHVGLQYLLLGKGEDEAVVAAVDDLARYKGAMALDATEAALQGTPVATDEQSLRESLAAMASQLGLAIDDPILAALHESSSNGKREFDEYLWWEQSSLVEGMVRAYARRRLKPLLEEFEVLEVEREGEWTLREGQTAWDGNIQMTPDIQFMSRPDALLRARVDGSLYLLSFKTASTWDRRKELDAQHDMQGLSEGVEVERRLGQRILGIRYEYMLKGYRGEDKALSAKFGFTTYSQRSHLTRAYVNAKTGDANWSWDFVKEDGGSSKLAWQNWKSTPVEGSIKGWIDKLDASVEAMSAYDSTTGMEPRSLGWQSPAQATGFTTRHPLDEIFIPPITVYRSDDDLRDWLEQTESQEVRVAEGAAALHQQDKRTTFAEGYSATDKCLAGLEDERRSLLNRHFSMTRRACSYPSQCAFIPVCYGGEDIRRDPLASGKYVRRTVNHPQELVNIKEQ